MADSHQPVVDAATRAALDQIADIVAPPPVSWSPQTWGWAAVAVALLAAASWALWRWLRWRQANRYRAEALEELSKLEAGLDDAKTRPLALAAIPPLLKRVALAAWPRPEVAALSGAPWIAFLRAHGGGSQLPDETARLLDDAEYDAHALSSIAAGDAKVVAQAARTWIARHRVSA
jgi:hypothetical protein